MTKVSKTVFIPRPAEEVFTYLADFSNTAEWDPGVDRVEQVSGDGAGPGASFDVGVKTPARTVPPSGSANGPR